MLDPVLGVNGLWIAGLVVVEHLYDWSMFEDLSGAELAAALAGVEVGSLDADAALGYALAAARLAGWVAAAEGAGLAQLKQTYPAFESAVDKEVHRLDTDRLILAEVRAAYGCSQVAASIKISFAEFLRDNPAVASALAAGVIRLEHARLLDRETVALAGNLALRAAVIDVLLAGHAAALGATGSGWTLRQWAWRTGRAVLEADPSRSEQAADDTRAERRVWHHADTAHAQGVFGVAGPVEHTAACHAAVDTLARRWRAEGRAGSLDQLRFDAAVGLLTGAEHTDHGGGVVGQVTMPLSSLVGVDDAPGELAGVGPIPASVARLLMAQAALWERLLTDPVDGHLVAQDIKRYRPTAAMRRFLRARAGGVCAARGCGHRYDLQLDHLIPAPDGPTTVDNLAPLCPGDHNAKTHGGWAHTLDPHSGSLTQISPLGRRYTTAPTPPVAPTGLRADPPRPKPDPTEFNDEYFFPTGEPPPGPHRGRDRTTRSAAGRGPLADHRRHHAGPSPHRRSAPARRPSRRTSPHPPTTRRPRGHHRLPADRRHQHRKPHRRPRRLAELRREPGGLVRGRLTSSGLPAYPRAREPATRGPPRPPSRIFARARLCRLGTRAIGSRTAKDHRRS
jgi:HNH endonuclease